MNTNALRQKILDLAIHGKLVKQDPTAESAAVLLEKIRAEKEKKIASGELKRDKNDSYIFIGDDNRHYEKFSDGRVKDIEDVLPFAVPEGWAWCRLGEVGSWRSGSTPNRKNIAFYQNGTIPWLLTGDLNDGIITDIPNKITEEAYSQTSLKLNPINSVCMAMYGATIGKLGILSTPASTNQACCVCSDFKGISNKYLFYFLLQHREEFIQLGFGGAQPNISKAKIITTLIPLPSLPEQQRIVTKIEAIFAQIDLLEQSKTDLQTAIKQAKSKILELAIHGKLVPQDPNDEPASVMLERLRAEKEAKIATGEVKRDKHDSYIYKNAADNCYYEKIDDGTEEQIEVPFDLPENWCWEKISSICKINPKNKLNDALEVSFVPMTLIDSEFNSNFTYELRTWRTVKSGFSHFSDNDIGIAKITPCFENRKSVIFKNLNNKHGAGTTELHILRINSKYILNEYVFWFIKTDSFIKAGISNFTGAVGQQRIGKEFLSKILIPIPPLNEQIKICRNINKIMENLAEIILNFI
ncbi:restriction endonuclease subunit S [Treponema medium]|uniref:Type I restriction modification DNA specificity domain-containing protein n=3 Tax=Treponema medium TaxID=58231 RepID=A0AA87NN77_TREMD|nr:restriction endonuclease subunit S [Treponema medium]EPF27635.1 hypothetical protein HMPREF9195_02387 [Treponema medium ATCC 700293]QSH98471.1 restriction endonuclease subunit S [Treponema medium]